MFSGLVQGTGKITELQKRGETIELTLAPTNAEILTELAIGDSVAVDGTCLTVVARYQRAFRVTLMPQTFEKTTFQERHTGDLVNLERSVQVGDRLEGHIVTGHIDEVTHVVGRRVNENAIEGPLRPPTPASRPGRCPGERRHQRGQPDGYGGRSRMVFRRSDSAYPDRDQPRPAPGRKFG